jgi:hypothetical protein
MYPNRVLIEHSCERCGCGFSSIKPEPKYCSRECYDEELAERMRERASALWKDPDFVERIQSARRAAGYPIDPDSVARAKMRGAIKRAIRRCIRAGAEKSGRTFVDLGYSPEQLRQHIEAGFAPGMSWANYGVWEVDHVRPIASFAIGTPVRVINALSNLQPLWRIENRKKWRHVGI